jgi:tetratricopeptide (TPR) repeat protein
VAKKAVKSKPAVKGQPSKNTPGPIENGPVTASKAKFAAILNSPYLPYLIIFLFSSTIYFNTLCNQYALDDVVVLTQNKFTQQGFAGIKDLMTHDANVGFYGEQGSELVAGGRYRPFSLVTFAIEVQLFGHNPMISHAINVLLFTLTCLLLYHLLLIIIPSRSGQAFYLSIPFIATTLFAGHPVHTEVVANIKGRDEIMGLLFSLMALWAAMKYIRTKKILHLAWGAVAFFLALLSKENAITFIVIIPLTYFFFTKAAIRDYVLTAGMYIVPIVAFLYMRALYTNTGLTVETTEILNNPFAYLPKNTDGLLQRYATVIMVFILYIGKLILPHPLSHDYYFNQIPTVGITNPLFLLSVVVNAGLLVYAIMGLRRKSFPSYAILFYFITFSIVSNLLFTVSMLMNERLIYMSSIGFCLLIAWLIIRAKERFKLPVQAISGILVIILLLYSLKTISRNRVWFDNLTLYLVDSKTSTNSSKAQLFAGSELTDLTDRNFDTLRQNGRLQHIADLANVNVDVTAIADSALRRQFLERAVLYIDSGIAIYPTRFAAWMILGKAVYKLHRDPKEALGYYEKANTLSGGLICETWTTMGIIQIENNMPLQAKESFIKALALKPDEQACRINLAGAYTNLKMNDSALLWYRKALELTPNNAALYDQIGIICGEKLSDIDMAIQFFAKAVEKGPDVNKYYQHLGKAFIYKNMPDDAIKVSEADLKKFPNDKFMLNIMANAYQMKGDMQKSHEYEVKSKQLSDQK